MTEKTAKIKQHLVCGAEFDCEYLGDLTTAGTRGTQYTNLIDWDGRIPLHAKDTEGPTKKVPGLQIDGYFFDDASQTTLAPNNFYGSFFANKKEWEPALCRAEVGDALTRAPKPYASPDNPACDGPDRCASGRTRPARPSPRPCFGRRGSRTSAPEPRRRFSLDEQPLEVLDDLCHLHTQRHRQVLRRVELLPIPFRYECTYRSP